MDEKNDDLEVDLNKIQIVYDSNQWKKDIGYFCNETTKTIKALVKKDYNGIVLFGEFEKNFLEIFKKTLNSKLIEDNVHIPVSYAVKLEEIIKSNASFEHKKYYPINLNYYFYKNTQTLKHNIISQ